MATTSPSSAPTGESPQRSAAPINGSGLTVLHRQSHGAMKLERPVRDFGFARESVTAAISSAELPAACAEFPCVMARQAGGQWALLAITGLESGHNLCVGPDGEWLGEHLPATLATWPFRLVRDNAEQGRFLVAVHTPALNATQGDALFDAEGNESAWLREHLQFLVGTDAALVETSQQIEALHAAGLLHERTLQAVLSNGREVELNGFMAVDESRLAGLSAEVLHSLHAQGALALAYLHLLSLRRFRALVARAGRASSPAAAPAPTAEAAPAHPLAA